MSEHDFLTEDPIKIPKQNYALISVVSPSSSQQYVSCALKIRGVFSTEKEAQKHANTLMQLDSNFDVFLVEMNKWLPIPPDMDKIEDQVYQNKKLNELIQGYHEEQFKSKQYFESRKQEEIEDAIRRLQEEKTKNEEKIEITELTGNIEISENV